jgi:hypothetical protein
MVVVRAGVVIITGTLLAQSFGPACSAYDVVCETLAEPWHIHHELPTGGTIRVTASAWSRETRVPESHILGLRQTSDTRAILINRPSLRPDDLARLCRCKFWNTPVLGRPSAS